MPITTPISSPLATNPTGATTTTSAASRAAAIAAFNQATAKAAPPEHQATIPVDANHISPEELGSIRAPEKGQSDTSVEASEASTEEVKSSPAKEEAPPLSSQYAVLARREKALRAKAQDLEVRAKSQEAAMAAREAAVKAKEAEYQTNYVPKDRLTTDTWNTLTELGITYDQLTQLALNPPAQESPAQKASRQRLEAKIQALEDSQANSQKTFQDSQAAQYQQALKQIRNEATQLIATDPNFETIQTTGSVGDVVELIEKTFKAEGVLLTVEEAAQAVEDYLMEEAMKITKIKKIQQKLQTVASQTAPKQQAPSNPQQKQPMKTLTNAVGSSRPLNAKERAILAFKGQLKD